MIEYRGVPTDTREPEPEHQMQDREVELKFQIPPDAIAHLEEHPLLTAALESEENFLHSVYFDTPQAELRKNGFVWRIRTIGERHIQTIKAIAEGIGRHEWECDVDVDQPNVKCLKKASANAVLFRKGYAKHLAPVFLTEVDRRLWNVEHDGSLIEISLDRGRVVAGEASASLCEVEFELKQGAPRGLFFVAQAFVAALPLKLDFLPKSHTGHRLAEGRSGPDTEPPKPGLRADMPLSEGFRALCKACLCHLMVNEPILVATRDPEALHQTRTAVRRLRAVLRVFARHVKDEALPGLRDEFKWLSRVLGMARDLDVMSSDFAAHRKTAGIAQSMTENRANAYERVIEAFGSARYRRLLLDFGQWLECGPWTTQRPRKQSRGTFQDICLLECARWDRKLLARGAHISNLDAEDRHKIRIQAKSFFYVCELTERILTGGRRGSHKKYLKALKALQATLGQLNDAHVAQETARALVGDYNGEDLEQAAKNAATRHARKESKLIDDARDAYKDFAAAPRAWVE
ncbi:MAG: metal-chelation protein [Hyphomicrobiales bacterium]|nr:metal-chelation protein [Hyphomicrobiales bacterium]